MLATKKSLKMCSALSIMIALLLNLLLMLPIPSVSASETNKTIYNNTFWKDTSGNNIYSQGWCKNEIKES